MPQTAPTAEAKARVDRLRAYAADAGRDPATIGIEPRLTLADVPEQDRAAYVEGWRNLGATHLAVNTMKLGLKRPEDHAAVLRDVLPRLRG
jgi:alkanesulfonate monooxygenase SsuD/methylene tetrahydromethanopterin reductase-like flavin-dependent oxidoreductase (luciferase family)